MPKYDQFATIIEAYKTDVIDDHDLEELLTILHEQYQEQHPEVLKLLRLDRDLMTNHRQIYVNVQKASANFEAALELADQASRDGNIELLDDALETFREGNVLLNDAVYEFEELMERSEVIGEL